MSTTILDLTPQSLLQILYVVFFHKNILAFFLLYHQQKKFLLYHQQKNFFSQQQQNFLLITCIGNM